MRGPGLLFPRWACARGRARARPARTCDVGVLLEAADLVDRREHLAQLAQALGEQLEAQEHRALVHLQALRHPTRRGEVARVWVYSEGAGRRGLVACRWGMMVANPHPGRGASAPLILPHAAHPPRKPCPGAPCRRRRRGPSRPSRPGTWTCTRRPGPWPPGEKWHERMHQQGLVQCSLRHGHGSFRLKAPSHATTPHNKEAAHTFMLAISWGRGWSQSLPGARMKFLGAGRMQAGAPVDAACRHNEHMGAGLAFAASGAPAQGGLRKQGSPQPR